MKNVSFSLSNYAKPTPKNLEFVFELLEDTLKFATAFSVWEEVDPWIPISILIFAFVCGKLKKFFATIAVGETEVVTVEYPAEIAHKIEVKQETKTETINE